jgi:hypothetical protein
MAVGAEAPKTRISKAFLAAYRAGRKAAAHGQKKMPPYKNHHDWRRVFRHYWTEGFADQEQGRMERYEGREDRG